MDLKVTLPWAFPFYGQRYQEIVATWDGRICFLSPAAACPVSAHSENNFKGGPPSVAAAFTAYESHILVRSAAVATDAEMGSWVKVSWSEVGAVIPTETYDVYLYQDGRVRFDYGPDFLDLPAIEGITSGGPAARAEMRLESPMIRNFDDTVIYRPYIGNANLQNVKIDQPLPGEVWVNGVRLATAGIPRNTGLPHAIIVGDVTVKASSTLPSETVSLYVGGGGSPQASNAGSVSYAWHPAKTGERITLRAETSQTKQVATVEVMVLESLADALAYRVDILSPMENEHFSEEVVSQTTMQVPVTWVAASHTCPVVVQFYELKHGSLSEVLKATVHLGLANQDTQIQMPLSLYDSSRTRLRADIQPEGPCATNFAAILGQPLLVKQDVTPPFIVDTNCNFIQVNTSEPESTAWLTSPPVVSVFDSRTCVEAVQVGASSTYPHGTYETFHYIFQDFEKGAGLECFKSESPTIVAPHYRASLCQSEGASSGVFHSESKYYSSRPAARPGDVFSFWVWPSTQSPLATVRVWIGATTVVDTVVPTSTWTHVTSTTLPPDGGGDLVLDIASTDGQSLVAYLDHMIQAGSWNITTEGKQHETEIKQYSTTGPNPEYVTLRYSLDMTPPAGTASMVNYGGYIPLTRAVPGSEAEAEVTILVNGQDAHSGVKTLEIHGDDGRIVTVPYATQLSWTFTVPWVAEQGVWLTAMRHVDVWFIDEAGLKSLEPAPAAVSIDGTFPLFEEDPVPAVGTWVGTSTPTVSIGVSDADSGVDSGQFVLGTNPPRTFAAQIVDGRLTATIEVPGTGNYSVKARARDVAGNWAETTFRLLIDLTPPSASMVGPAFTRVRGINVGGSVDDIESGMADRRIAEDDVANVAWVSTQKGTYSTSLVLSPGDGKKLIRGEFRDHVGNIAPRWSNITLDTRGPNITPVSPLPDSTGNNPVGLKVRATFADDKSVTATVSGIDTTGLQVFWYDSVTGQTKDVTSDPRMTKDANGAGFTYEPVVLPGGHFYKVYVYKADRAGNIAVKDWGFWTA